MDKVIVISDSFKGSLSSAEISDIASDTIHKFFPLCEVVGIPVADGGEGTVECFLEATNGIPVNISVDGPWREPIDATYVRIGDTAVIEMAKACGLPLVRENRDPSLTTTYGVGQLLRHAIEDGAKHLVLGLGGSATNDGGCGAAAAMGVEFKDINGKPFVPVGATLNEIAAIDISNASKLLKGVTFEVMCDIDNPLCGRNGAAAVFAPQKGANKAMVEMLDLGLGNLANKIEKDLGLSVANLSGAGAAGGFGAGAVAFFGAMLRPGIEVVLDLVDFDNRLRGCDLVITGEGRMDSQSLGGKVPIGVARRANKQSVPVVAVVGVTGPGIEAVYDEGITAVFTTNREARPFDEISNRAKIDYRNTITDLMRMIKRLNDVN